MSTRSTATFTIVTEVAAPSAEAGAATPHRSAPARAAETSEAGVRIGDGAIIGALAVVASDVPPYGVAAGNPARIVKRRFDDTTIARLLRLRWWDWPAEKITRNLAAIKGADIHALERAR